MEEDWKTTGGAEPQSFLIYDSGPEAGEERMLIWAAKEGLVHMARNDCWFMDGNFAMAPDITKQIYVIRTLLGDSSVSTVYALLPGKTYEQYKEMLEAIVAHCAFLGFNLDPKIIVTDFEAAVIKALQDVFGEEIDTQGCFFHLIQSIWRRLHYDKLVGLYNSNQDMKFFCGMLAGLALLPLEDVEAGFAYLKANTPEGFEKLVYYFEKTYVKGELRRIQLPPRQMA